MGLFVFWGEVGWGGGGWQSPCFSFGGGWEVILLVGVRGFGVPRNRKRCLAALAIFGESILVDVRCFSASGGGGVLWLE